MRGDRRPILVTGSHRSGTTWLATMLGLAPEALTIPKEPFNPNRRDYALGGLADRWFAYVPDLPAGRAERAFERVLTGRAVKLLRHTTPPRQALAYLRPWARPRLVIHDPIAAFSSEWLANVFDLQVLVLVRHPAAFAASLRRMGWQFDPANLRSQPRLVSDHLGDFVPPLDAWPQDPMARAGVLWRCIYTVLTRYADRNPTWIVCRHEDLSLQPQERLQELYGRLELRWTADVASAIGAHTSPDNPVAAPDGVAHQLRRDSAANLRRWTTVLSPAEQDRVRRAAEPLAGRYYTDADWRPAVPGPARPARSRRRSR